MRSVQNKIPEPFSSGILHAMENQRRTAPNARACPVSDFRYWNPDHDSRRPGHGPGPSTADEPSDARNRQEHLQTRFRRLSIEYSGGYDLAADFTACFQCKQAISCRAELATHIPVIQRESKNNYITSPYGRLDSIHIVLLYTGAGTSTVSAEAAFTAVGVHAP